MTTATPTLGVCYYPEHWDEKLWADDAARMVAAGLSWVRIGEFAWSRLEPKEGDFHWDWLDRAIETLGAAGLQICLGTPSATPPRWLLAKHPDMLAQLADGRVRAFGSRRHYCFSHAGYRAEAARMAGAMAARYGKNPHIGAWQIDNEYGCHATTLSFSAAARAGFRDWLAQRYQSPDALNRAWGNVFWSMEYGGFDEVDLPNGTVTEPNPAHVFDFREYASAAVVAFNRASAEAIRAHSTAPLVHNYMGRTTDFDHYAVGEDLDIASWDSYPLGFLEEALEDAADWKTRFYRQGDPDFQAFHHDLYRAVGRGRFWIMEQQPGPVNWAAWNPIPRAGMVRLWGWEAIAHGAEVVSFFRWRQAPFAQEQMHAGLLRVDGEGAAGLAEVAQLAGEIGGLQESQNAGVGADKKNNVAPSHVDSSVALVFDYPSQWAWEVQPQGRDFDYFRLVFEAYRALRRLGLSIDIIPARAEALAGRSLVVIPGLMQMDADFARAVGGSEATIILGPRTNSKTDGMNVNPDAPSVKGLGVRVDRVASLRPSVQIALDGGGFVHKWLEDLRITDADIIEQTTDGEAVFVGKGARFYQGAWLNDAAQLRVMAAVAKHAGLAVAQMPEGLRKRKTPWGDEMLINYNAEAVNFNDIRVKACDIAWLSKNMATK